MNESGQRLQQAIRAQREHTLKLRAWVLLSCPNPMCSIKETNVWVEEMPGCRPFQAPCRCVRCSSELQFEGLDP
jgi:hypothetical protein